MQKCLFLILSIVADVIRKALGKELKPVCYGKKAFFGLFAMLGSEAYICIS